MEKSTEGDEILEISTEEAALVLIFPEKVGDGIDEGDGNYIENGGRLRKRAEFWHSKIEGGKKICR